jgi:hypothetical protein
MAEECQNSRVYIAEPQAVCGSASSSISDIPEFTYSIALFAQLCSPETDVYSARTWPSPGSLAQRYLMTSLGPTSVTPTTKANRTRMNEHWWLLMCMCEGQRLDAGQMQLPNAIVTFQHA